MLKKLTFGGLGLFFLTSPLLVSADTLSDLRAQIQSLLAQITQLKVQMNAASGPTGAGSSCLILTNALIIGSTDAKTGGEVSKLQRFLVSESVYPEAQITGYYGNLTAQAVVRWQKAHGMDFATLKSGVGPMTRGKIRERCGQANSTMTISGEYEYSDMAGFSTFRTANDPFGTPAVIVENAKTRQPETDGPYGTMSGFSLHNAIVGTLNQLGDTCGLIIEATVEIANPQKIDFLKDRQGYDIVSADFVRLVSKGRVFDNCTTVDGNNNITFVRTQRL